jgi:HAD superfamily hydrolase (TIGR01450 family)
MTERTIHDIRAFLLDMDGTLYVTEQLVPGALEFLALLRERELPYVFLTNNSSQRAEYYRDRLRRLGIAAETSDILTSGEATVHHLRTETPHRRVYLLGTPSLEAEFAEGGFTLVDAKEPDCVVVGFDKTLTYEKLKRACLLVAAGVPYFATHPDFTCIEDEGLIPDTGAFTEAIRTVTHRTPKVIGKPQPEMVAAALARLGHPAAESAMVGDQLDTDQTMANRAGLFGVLVLSGETSRERLEAQRGVRPDLVVENVGELGRVLSISR